MQTTPQPVLIIPQTEFENLLARVTTQDVKIMQIQKLLSETGQQLSLQDFCKRAAISVSKAHGLIEKGKIKFNQNCNRGRITIPISELLNFKQI